MKILINSTTYLLPNNHNWDLLKKENKVIFSDYGNLNSNLSKDVNLETNLIFLPDLFDYYLNSKSKINGELKKVSNIINLVKNKLKFKNKKLVIGISEYLYQNVINYSQKPNVSKKIKIFFMSELYKLVKKNNNLFIIDLDEVFSENGLSSCLDQRNYYLFRSRVSSLGIQVISNVLNNLVERIKYSNKKVLLVDCDNTLWGGVVGEDGIENIQIGQDGIGTAFSDFQKTIKKLKDSGILIVLVSKNEKFDVENVLKNHKSMVLKLSDITAMKINWQEKYKNIKQLSEDLSLGLNSFVFWDDNPIEREKVRNKLKDVEVVEPNEDVTSWPKQLLELKAFSKFYISKEDNLKTKQYKIRDKFVQDKNTSRDEIHYLKSINIKPMIVKIDNSTLNRTVQMCQKTNQFNLRTIRYDAKDILRLKKENNSFLVSLKDNYGDHGIVAFVSLKIINKKFLFIDTFLMSCRVLGRYLESWILNKIKKIAIKSELKSILVEYLPTKRNIVAKNFILEHNFEKVSKKNNLKYVNFIQKINNNKDSEYFTLSTKSKIPNLEIYEKH